MKVICLSDISDSGVKLAIQKGKQYDVLDHYERDGEEYYHLSHCNHDVGFFKCDHFKVIER